MTTAEVPSDPLAATKAVLTAAVAASSTYSGTPVLVSLSGKVPDRALIVRPDGLEGGGVANSACPLRVIAYAPSEFEALALARWALAALRAFPGSAAARRYTGLSGPLSAYDDVSTRPLAWINATANMLPIPITL